MLAEDTDSVLLAPSSAHKNSLASPFVHSPLDHPRLLHHPQAWPVLVVYNRSDVKLRERQPKGSGSSASFKHCVDRLGCVPFTPSGREIRIGNLYGQSRCCFGCWYGKTLWQREAGGIEWADRDNADELGGIVVDSMNSVDSSVAPSCFFICRQVIADECFGFFY